MRPWQNYAQIAHIMALASALAGLQKAAQRAQRDITARLVHCQQQACLLILSWHLCPCLQDSKKPRSELKETLLLAIPTFFDLLATILMNIGLLYVTASVYQMMRGAEMLFAALFAVTFLGRRLNRFHLLGILCCVVS